MTGVQTFINHQGGGTAKSVNNSSTNSTTTENDTPTWPLAQDAMIPQDQSPKVLRSEARPVKAPAARPLESTGNDTLTSVIGMYQDGSHRG